MDPMSPNFMNINIEQVLKNSKLDALQFPTQRDTIHSLRQSLETTSKQKEFRILRGKKRKISFRKWQTHSPNHILLGRLFFLAIRRIISPLLPYSVRLCTQPYPTNFFLILGDLAFLPALNASNKNKTTILVLMDSFSRLIHLR